MKKCNAPFLAALSVLTWVILLPRVQAVVPAPDGGYPGGNTAEGQNALLSITTGGYNTAVGYLSLRSDTLGQLNTGLGAGALLANTADANTAVGAGALLSNATGGPNTAMGAFALFSNTEGRYNTAAGQEALFMNTTGSANTALGDSVLSTVTTGSNNTAVGTAALLNATGNDNTAAGVAALSNTSGDRNTALGLQAGGAVVTASNVICIGSDISGADVSDTCFIGSIRGVTTINNDAVPVLIDSNNQLGTASSSRRFKTDIKPIGEASECLLQLKPVSFRYKAHKDSTPQFGLIAEDVAEINPALVVHDRNGDIYTVRYDAVNAMLLNEFLKEHRKVESQERKLEGQENAINQLKEDLETVVARLENQDSKLQKVNAQLEIKRETTTVAASDP